MKIVLRGDSVSVNNKQLKDVAAPTENGDAVNLEYFNSHSGGGTDPNAIAKDGSTTTTAPIPFAEGIKVTSISEITPDSGIAIESDIDFNNHNVTGINDPTDPTGAANKQYVDTAVSTAGNGKFLPLSGGTMSGVLNAGSQKITGLADPSENTDAVNLQYFNAHTGSSTDPNAIAKDGSTTTTAPIPFAAGIKTGTILGLNSQGATSITVSDDDSKSIILTGQSAITMNTNMCSIAGEMLSINSTGDTAKITGPGVNSLIAYDKTSNTLTIGG